MHKYELPLTDYILDKLWLFGCNCSWEIKNLILDYMSTNIIENISHKQGRA